MVGFRNEEKIRAASQNVNQVVAKAKDRIRAFEIAFQDVGLVVGIDILHPCMSGLGYWRNNC